jgi:hypothetical protein
MTARRFPAPWCLEEQPARFVVRDHDGQTLAHVYFERCLIAFNFVGSGLAQGVVFPALALTMTRGTGSAMAALKSDALGNRGASFAFGKPRSSKVSRQKFTSLARCLDHPAVTWSEKLGGLTPLHRFEKNLAPALTNDKEETHKGNLQCYVAGRSLLPVNKDTASTV